jgi:hypothetical protein
VVDSSRITLRSDPNNTQLLKYFAGIFWIVVAVLFWGVLLKPHAESIFGAVPSAHAPAEPVGKFVAWYQNFIYSRREPQAWVYAFAAGLCLPHVFFHFLT